ncbi:MAG TPA: hypothetical protein VGP72_08390 [Planctomycetota bacterium]
MPSIAKPGEVWCVVTTPARFESVCEQVMVEKASCRYETIPAVYENQCETVCCREESKRCHDVPAVYKTETYSVQKCAERTEWKKVDCCNADLSGGEHKGDCYGLVTIPAKFETCSRQVLVTPASKWWETIPAEYKTVEKRVCVSPESKRRIDIPARYETRTKQVCVDPGHKVWRLTTCSVPTASDCGCAEKPACKTCLDPCSTCSHEWFVPVLDNQPAR